MIFVLRWTSPVPLNMRRFFLIIGILVSYAMLYYLQTTIYKKMGNETLLLQKIRSHKQQDIVIWREGTKRIRN